MFKTPVVSSRVYYVVFSHHICLTLQLILFYKFTYTRKFETSIIRRGCVQESIVIQQLIYFQTLFPGECFIWKTEY